MGLESPAGTGGAQPNDSDFTSWLADRGETAPDSLEDDRFTSLASAFFEAVGWGQVHFTTLSDAVLALDTYDWAEAEGEGSNCHVSTGLFAGFFGRLANAPIAVLEVQCRSADDSRCRFLLGSIDVLAYVHEAMGRGIPYDRAAASA